VPPLLELLRDVERVLHERVGLGEHLAGLADRLRGWRHVADPRAPVVPGRKPIAAGGAERGVLRDRLAPGIDSVADLGELGRHAGCLLRGLGSGGRTRLRGPRLSSGMLMLRPGGGSARRRRRLHRRGLHCRPGRRPPPWL
jgi:hypothetical protein